MKHRALGIVFALTGFPAFAQVPVALDGTPDAPALESKIGDYSLTQSWEFGYRFSEVGGNEDEYRSVVNFGDGLRLFSGNLEMHSLKPAASWLDDLTLQTTGLGNDPYESARFHLSKRRLYSYDLNWRENDYFNPALVVSSGSHLQDTTYTWQDHTVTLFPDSPYSLFAGYSRFTEDGLALSSVQLFDFASPQFPLFANLKRQENDYRAGGEVHTKHIRLTVQRKWGFGREDTPQFLLSDVPVIPTAAATEVTGFTRTEPLRDQSPGWLVNLFASFGWFELHSRFTYQGGAGDFIFDENALGTDRFGASQNVETLVTGSARHPSTAADISEVAKLGSKTILQNETSVFDSRIVGNNLFEQFNFASLSEATVNFQYLGFRFFTNRTEIRADLTRTLGVFASYQYSDRRVASDELGALPGSPLVGLIGRQTNIVHGPRFGFHWRPVTGLTFLAQGGFSRASAPFYPKSDRDAFDIVARVRYTKRAFEAVASYQQRYNNNSIDITSYASHARTYSAEIGWNRNSRFGLTASYNFLHLDTLGGIAYFAGTPFPQELTGTSIYISNVHAANLGITSNWRKRINVFLGYSFTFDAGDGRTTPGLGIFAQAQTFPLRYQSPSFRFSYLIDRRLTWNAGFQFYGYGERFGLLDVAENFHANTGYTSFTWSF